MPAAVGQVPVPAPPRDDRRGRGHGIEAWDDFLARGQAEPRALVEATAAAVQPSDPAVLFFSSGSTSRPKGILSAHRGVAIQLWRCRRMYEVRPGGPCPLLDRQRLLLVGQLRHGARRRRWRAAAARAAASFDAAEALELMEAERVSCPLAWPHQWAQLEAAPDWARADLSSLRFVDDQHPDRAPSDGVLREWTEPGRAYGNTETFTITTCFPASTPPEVAGSSGEALPGNTLKIVDPLTGAVVPRGERGEICVKGPTLMLGYIGMPLDETLDERGLLPHRRRRLSRRRRAGSSGKAGSPTSSRPAAPTSRRSRSTRRWPLSRREDGADRRRAARDARRDRGRLRRAA